MTKISVDIIQRCKKGEQSAFSEVYKLLYAPLLATSKRYINDHEEAVFQMNTGFAHAMCNLEKWQNQGNDFGAWIRRVVINCIIDELRKKKRYQDHLINLKQHKEAESNNAVEFNSAQHKLQYEDLLRLLDILPEVTREVFNLFVLDGFKHVEISELLGLSTGTTKWHVARGRKILMKAILENDELKQVYDAPNRAKKQVL